MATAVQTRLSEAYKEAQALNLKGILTGDDATRFETLVSEMESLAEQAKTAERFSAQAESLTKSAGMLPLAAGEAPVPGQVYVEGMKYAGQTVVEHRRDQVGGRIHNSFEILDQWGEGISSTKAFASQSSAEYREAFKTYIRKGKDHLKADGLKVLQEGIDTEGGFTAPPDLMQRIVAKEPTPTRVAGNVTQLTTLRDKLIMPRVNYASASDDSTGSLYTTGMRVTWTSEIPSSGTAAAVTDPLFGQTDIPIYTAMMTLAVTNDLLEDAGFPLMSWITGKFAETVDLVKDNLILNGTGIGQATGILANPGGTNQPSVITSGSSSTIGTDGEFLVKLSMSLPEQYDDNSKYYFNKTSTGLAIAQLQDSNHRFLWGSGLQDSGLMPTWKNRVLLGYPVVLSGFMPNIGASTYPLIFGDLGGYYLVNRVSFSIQVLREVLATVNQIQLVGRLRFGGQVVEPWKILVGQAHT